MKLGNSIIKASVNPVAPSRGRGLKQFRVIRNSCEYTVAPSRGRGLKRVIGGYCRYVRGRPFTGAWIETSRHRGAGRRTGVAPSRGRGLKLLSVIARFEGPGRPFTGAWIETGTWNLKGGRFEGRPFTGAWIETSCPHSSQISTRSPLHGGVD